MIHDARMPRKLRQHRPMRVILHALLKLKDGAHRALRKRYPMNDCRNRPRRDGYDVAVVGAGSAGFSAAITAAELGAKVALIGHGVIGGTCVNVGCVPSKTLIRAAAAVHGGRAATRFPGLGGHLQLGDWAQLAAYKDELVNQLRQKKYVDLLPAYEGVSRSEERRVGKESVS